MSDHSFIPKANPKIVPPAIPAPRKESFEEENARLKADVVELADALKLASEVGIKVADEVTRLKAEVDRLRASSFVTAVPAEQYERLVKAGDELLDGWIGMYGDHKGSMAENYIELWNDAKWGKQP